MIGHSVQSTALGRVGKFQRKQILIRTILRGGVEGGLTPDEQGSTFNCTGQFTPGRPGRSSSKRG